MPGALARSLAHARDSRRCSFSTLRCVLCRSSVPSEAVRSTCESTPSDSVESPLDSAQLERLRRAEPRRFSPRTAADSYPGDQRFVFTLTGMPDDERSSLSAHITRLGGTVIDDAELHTDAFDWDRVTHVVCAAHPQKGIQRSPKVWMSLTWGRHMTRTTFFLHPSYLTRSGELGRFADEQEFLWANHPDLLTNGTSVALTSRIQLYARPIIGSTDWECDLTHNYGPVCFGLKNFFRNRHFARLFINMMRRMMSHVELVFVNLEAEPAKIDLCHLVIYCAIETVADRKKLELAQRRAEAAGREPVQGSFARTFMNGCGGTFKMDQATGLLHLAHEDPRGPDRLLVQYPIEPIISDYSNQPEEILAKIPGLRARHPSRPQAPSAKRTRAQSAVSPLRTRTSSTAL